MNSKEEISVLITVYNGEEYLQETIDSIASQSFHNFKCIIVDDGSEDKTKHILASIDDDRFEIINLPRKGRGGALNVGLERCETEFVAILDADDLANSHRLHIQYAIFNEYPGFDVVASCLTIDKSRLDQITTQCLPAVTEVDYKKFIRRNAICHSSAMIRVAALRAAGGYDASRTELFDYDLWIRMMTNGCRFLRVEAPLVYKRIHDGQKFENRKRIKYLWSATKCKYRAVQIASDNILDYFVPMVTCAYGMLPRKFRRFWMETNSRL